MLKVFELTVKCYLNNNIKQEDVSNQIGFLLDLALGKSEEFLEMHKKNMFKNYVFNGFYPLEREKIYKEDYIYTFQIRTIDNELANYLKENLRKVNSNCINVLRVSIEEKEFKKINKLYSITPAIMKNDFGYWKNNISLDEYKDRIKKNLIKKYNTCMGNEIGENFELISNIKFINNKPIKFNYKGINFLGDKIELEILDNEKAQLLSYMSLGTGILELNARGMGYINYK
ncbi:CRISPR-associated endoribonuclease Cas6 [Clostridium sp. B9]|uniref:CRISPR-associated endoribonuclease Cas6 n=1 Tax=Clostridium sp. B9 TaxID=3423224 RepID=UPI003D2EF494